MFDETKLELLLADALKRAFNFRRMSQRGDRGRTGFAPAAGAGGTQHLLDTNGVDILTDGGSNRLLNG